MRYIFNVLFRQCSVTQVGPEFTAIPLQSLLSVRITGMSNQSHSSPSLKREEREGGKKEGRKERRGGRREKEKEKGREERREKEGGKEREKEGNIYSK